MEFELFRQQVSADVFDYQILTNHLRELKKPRDKISSLISEGKIIRVKKGLYVFGERWRKGPISLETIANLVYGPSCISFEYALSHYGLIAERSLVITSLTIGNSKTFDTPLGVFTYQAIDQKKFKVGIEYVSTGKEGGYFIASKEKALLDLVYRTPNIRTLKQLEHYLFEEMRVDESLFRNLDFQKIAIIAEVYNKNSVKMVSSL